MKVLVIKISSLGDVVHSIAFINRLKSQRPELTVDWLIGDAYGELGGSAPTSSRGQASSPQADSPVGVRRSWLFRRGEWGKNWWRLSTWMEISALITAIRAEKYDVCLDLQGLLRSGLITLFSGAKKRAGFSDAREGAAFCYDVKLDPGASEHAVAKLLKALSLFDVELPGEPSFKFDVPAGSAAAVGKVLKEMGVSNGYVVFHPGARWATKQWPKQKWSRLAETVYKTTGLPLLFTGSSGEARMIDEICSGRSGLFSTAGRLSLMELSALIKDAKLMVTVDSGPMHIAAAFSTPIVALFGPTSPAKTGPISSGPVELLTDARNFDCAPCFKRSCNLNPNCMEKIAVDDVAAKILDLLG